MPAKKTARSAKVAQTIKRPFLDITRTRLEGMYALHIILLLVMTSLTATLFTVVMQQKHQLENLKFKVNFYEDRYSFEKGKNGMYQASSSADIYTSE